MTFEVSSMRKYSYSIYPISVNAVSTVILMDDRIQLTGQSTVLLLDLAYPKIKFESP